MGWRRASLLWTLTVNEEEAAAAGRARCRRWYARNRAAQQERVRLYREKYPEKAKAAVTRYSQSPRGRYVGQKIEAEQRGVTREITFDEWLAWWGDDLPKRGPGKDGLVMARYKDAGPYKIGNIYKATLSQNASDAHKFRREREHC